jgi:hypothetical protein
MLASDEIAPKQNPEDDGKYNSLKGDAKMKLRSQVTDLSTSCKPSLNWPDDWASSKHSLSNKAHIDFSEPKPDKPKNEFYPLASNTNKLNMSMSTNFKNIFTDDSSQDLKKEPKSRSSLRVYYSKRYIKRKEDQSHRGEYDHVYDDSRKVSNLT